MNGIPIRERTLTHGDHIRIGSCEFVIVLREDEREALPSAVLRDQPLFETRTIVQLRGRDSLYLNPKDMPPGAVSSARAQRNLKALIDLCALVHSASSIDVFARTLMEIVFDTVPAAEGALLLLEAGPGEPSWTFGWRRESGPSREVLANTNLVRRAFEGRVAILTNDQPGVSQDKDTDEIEPLPPSTLIAPLEGADAIIGVLFLASHDREGAFDEEDLQLIAAIGNLGGLALESALRFGALEAENRRLREEIDLEHDMVGDSAAMRRVYQFVAKVAHADSTVLITGESGTGKELVARAVHRNSPRADRPFLAINCAALAESLLESELFGHERGAFTGAITRKQGKFELAGSGSIFLDEVAELSPKLQAKLLRVLQEREFERVGGTHPLHMNARVIAATNRDLGRAVSGGTFREDLYFRLNVVSIEMPPLRQRRQDIPLLANYFVAAIARRLGRRVVGLSSEARRRLLHYDWPGNVRELENAVERAVVLGVSDHVLAEDLPEAIGEAATAAPGKSDDYQAAVREAKRKIILAAIDNAGGSQSKAAAALGVNPAYLSRLIRNLDLKDEIGSRHR